MRVLHTVESYLPARHGMSEVVRQISERLAGRGVGVTVATSADRRRRSREIDGVSVEEFRLLGNRVRADGREARRYQQYLRDGAFDVVTNFAAEQWATDLALPILDQISGKKVLVPTGFSRLYDPEFRDYFAALPERMRHYDVNVFLSEGYRDVRFAREHGIERTVTIPNGAAEDEFLAPPAVDVRARLALSPAELLVLHVGDYTGAKGHPEAVEIFSASSLEGAALVLVSDQLAATASGARALAAGAGTAARRLLGRPARAAGPASIHRLIRRHRALNERARRRILVVSLPRPETVAAFHAADLFLFPSNVECSPIVLFECLASRTPFLATDAGNAGEIVASSSGGELLPTVADDSYPGYVRAEIEPSARALERLVADEARRREMAESGFRAWQSRFTWERIAERYEHLYRSLLAS